MRVRRWRHFTLAGTCVVVGLVAFSASAVRGHPDAGIVSGSVGLVVTGMAIIRESQRSGQGDRRDS